MTEKVNCPYNPAHVVEPRRYRYHIDKCRKTAANAGEFSICRYDQNHHVRKELLESHYETCPGRVQLERALCTVSISGKSSLNLPKPTVNVLAMPECEENWDEGPRQVFDPQERINTAPYMVVPAGLTPSERKAYYKEHQLRLMQAKDGHDAARAQPVVGATSGNLSGSGVTSQHQAGPLPNASQPLGRGRGLIRTEEGSQDRRPGSAGSSAAIPSAAAVAAAATARNVAAAANTRNVAPAAATAPAALGIGRGRGVNGWARVAGSGTSTASSILNDDDFPAL